MTEEYYRTQSEAKIKLEDSESNAPQWHYQEVADHFAGDFEKPKSAIKRFPKRNIISAVTKKSEMTRPSTAYIPSGRRAVSRQNQQRKMIEPTVQEVKVIID